MKIVIAVDSFKGSLSSLEAGEAISQGIQRVSMKENIRIRPLADGGEGTVEALVAGMGGTFLQAEVTGPLGSKVHCSYGMINETKTAILEMSGAAGITLVTEKDRNPLYTTTYGVGETIRDAIQKGCRRFVIGIGGSATNDGGVGMLQALGFDFLDKEGNQIARGAIGLSKLVEIREDNVLSELKECEFHIACDVTNPLYGEFGCSAVYGPQKGATAAMIVDMDQWMQQYAAIAQKKYSKADPEYKGTGAAGGMGFAFLTFMNAVLEPGVTLVLEETKLRDFVMDADIVVTGEGRLDGQTIMGKAPIGVAKLAKKYQKKVIAFAGCVDSSARACNENGIDAYFPVLRTVTTLDEAMLPENAKRNMADTAEQVFRLILNSNQ